MQRWESLVPLDQALKAHVQLRLARDATLVEVTTTAGSDPEAVPIAIQTVEGAAPFEPLPPEAHCLRPSTPIFLLLQSAPPPES